MRPFLFAFFVASPLLVFIVLMAFLHEQQNDQSPQQVRRDWPQQCEMCGTQWTVTPNDPAAIVPPTIEWCFNDGNYCETGFRMILDAGKHGESDQRNRQFLNHCIECQGCRCAAFEPVEWREVTEAIKRIRAGQSSPSPKQVDEYIKSHNGSAPPASWYPNGDPWRNPTAEELEQLEQDDDWIGGGPS